MKEDGGGAFAPVDWAVLRHFLSGDEVPAAGYAHRVYEQEDTVVVLGRSRGAGEDVHLERCARDGVPVLRRAGGGGTVVLSRGVVVVSVAGRTSLPFHLREQMNAVNALLVSVLEGLGVGNLGIRGISDIARGDRKIGGSSLFRTRDVVLYQGSVLVDPDFDLFERYLRHPSKEPDYRMGRGHRDFLTSLRGEGFEVSPAAVVEAVRRALDERSPFLFSSFP
jgi:lipoate-protein ligase A